MGAMQPSSPEEVPRTVLTVSVTQDEAEEIVLCRHSAIPTFALLTDESKVDNEPGATPRDLFPELFRRVP